MNKPKVQITFPSILLIPLFSIIGIILKIFGLTDYDWMHVVMTAPISYYFMWCVGYCVIATIGVITIKIISKFSK